MAADKMNANEASKIVSLGSAKPLWNTAQFVPVPSEKELVHKVSVKDATVNVGGMNIFYRDAAPPAGVERKNLNLLMLHGQAFSSKTWLDLGTMSLMAALGFHVTAVDLPGYGNSKEASLGGKDKDKVLAVLIAALKIDRAVIVSPSMSGSFALPYLIGSKIQQFEVGQPIGDVLGYIPVAPVATDRFGADQYKKFGLPTMIVYGSKDSSLGLSSLEKLRQIPNSVAFEISNAGHACYMNQPDEWHRLLYNFLLSVAKL